MAPIPDRDIGHQPSLSDLTEGLRQLMMMAQQGEWEQITDYCNHLLPLLIAVDQMAHQPIKDSSFSRQNVEETMALLQAAIEKCTERKGQIEPLVRALIPSKPD